METSHYSHTLAPEECVGHSRLDVATSLVAAVVFFVGGVMMALALGLVTR